MSLTKSEKINLGTKEIAKRVRTKLRKIHPECKFSVRMESFSGGSSIDIGLMSASFEAVDRKRQMTRYMKTLHNPTSEDAMRITDDAMGYSQLSYFSLKDGFEKSEGVSNGTCLTKEAWEVLSDAVDFAQHYNYDDSDSMVDYFDTNFYLSVNVGSYAKDFEVK